MLKKQVPRHVRKNSAGNLDMGCGVNNSSGDLLIYT